MTRKPNYELLKDAYAILGGIPGNKINLQNLRTKRTKHSKDLDCGTICCGIGWLAHHPKFQAEGLGFATDHRGVSFCLTYGGKKMDFEHAGAKLFNIEGRDAYELFRRTDGDRQYHKAILLNRIMRFLDDAGKVKSPWYYKESK